MLRLALHGIFADHCLFACRVTWHQTLRKSITGPADFVLGMLKIPKGTWMSKYGQLYLGFLMSAVLHHAGAYMIFRRSGGMYTLWLSQAIVITLEDFIIFLGKRAGFTSNGEEKIFQSFLVS